MTTAAVHAGCRDCDFIGPSRPLPQAVRDFHRAVHQTAFNFLAALAATWAAPRQDDYVLTGYNSNHAAGRAVDVPAGYFEIFDELTYCLRYTPAEIRRRARRRAREAARRPAQTALWTAYRRKTRRRNRRRNR